MKGRAGLECLEMDVVRGCVAVAERNAVCVVVGGVT